MNKKPKRSQERRITRRAQVIRYLRVSRRISQRDAARLCGCSEQAVGHYENGRMDVSDERLATMLKAYGYSYDEFAAYMAGKEITVDLKAECIAILSQLDEARIKLVYGLLTNFTGAKATIF